jgi:hypothetical protein
VHPKTNCRQILKKYISCFWSTNNYLWLSYLCISFCNFILVKRTGFAATTSVYQGISRKKANARNYCWWPNREAQIENIIVSCQICGVHRADPPEVVPQTWPETVRPMKRVHMDFFGTFLADGRLTAFLMFGQALTTHLSRLNPSNIRSEIPSTSGIVG